MNITDSKNFAINSFSGIMGTNYCHE